MEQAMKKRAKTKPKPATPLAKAEAKFMANCRTKHLRFDEDVARYGRDVAIYNAGFIAGDENRKRKMRKR